MSRRNGPNPERWHPRALGGRRDNGARPPEPETSEPETSQPVRVLYIAGIGRSGSTLLNRTLGATPGLFAGGELMHFFGRGVSQNELCACGTPFRRCEVWGEVIRELGPVTAPERAAAIDPFRHAVTEGKHLLTMLLSPWKPPSLRRRLAAYERTVAQVYRAVQRVTGCRVLVDSSKNLSYARILQGVPGIRVFIVHLVRDPRGVTYSMSKSIRRPGVPWQEEYLSRRGPVAGSVLWTAANIVAETLVSRADGYVRIRYTDFVASPAGALRRILRLAGEPEEEGRLDHVRDRTLRLGVQHILSGNPVRAKTGEIPLQEDDEWRREMGSARRRLVSTVTLPLLLRYDFLGADGRRDGAVAVTAPGAGAAGASSAAPARAPSPAPAGAPSPAPTEAPSPAPGRGRGTPVAAPSDGAD